MTKPISEKTENKTNPTRRVGEGKKTKEEWKSDLSPFKHGEEGTHSICNKHQKLGTCCECSGRRSCSDRSEVVAMGVSQWRNHGQKYGYWKFFEKEIKSKLLQDMLEDCDENENENGSWLVERFKKKL